MTESSAAPQAELSPGKKELLELEKTRKYLFHGSPDPQVEEFEPRQGYTVRDGMREPDEFPAIFASSRADYAILMAIINITNCPAGSQSGLGKKSPDRGAPWRFWASEKTHVQLTDESSGVVYVFNREDFDQRGDSAEFRSIQNRKPLKSIAVTRRDLPHVECVPDTKVVDKI